MNIINVKLENLKPYENNPRINDNSVEPVAKSIKEFGFKVPIIIDKNNIIIAGHTRYKAAKKLKLSEVPCVVADDLTDEQIKAFRLVDNKVGENSIWDYDKLDEELKGILDIDMEDFGFLEFNDNNNFINELLDNGYVSKSPDYETFTISFSFPINKKNEIIEFVKEMGKEYFVNKIIEEMERHNA